jgi:predicted ABC-type ATPase
MADTRQSQGFTLCWYATPHWGGCHFLFQSMSKKIIIIAGPNGAGKTTFARSFLPEEAQCPRFINADLIAAGLSPFAPETAALKAGRLMLAEIADCVRKEESFAFETTLSGQAYLKKIAVWQQLGYQVKLWFLSLPTEDIAVSRVAQRVRQGGHNIPENVIRRRFQAGLENFHKRYSNVVNSWAFYDSYHRPPKLIDWSDK